MNVLITGGAGFIGAHVGHALQERGDTVTVLDNFNEYYDPKLKWARVRALLHTDTRIVEADIADGNAVTQAIRDVHPDAVIHLAAWAGVRPSHTHARLFGLANVQGTINVFEACREHSVRRVLFASSSSVYGTTAPVPSPESSAADTQQSGYGVSKRAGELYASLYHRLDGLQVMCLRYFTVYGPWGRPDMAIWKFTERILAGRPIRVHVRSADGREVRRGFTHVGDIVRGTVSALDQDLAFGIMNVGNDDSVPLRRFVAAIEAASGVSATIEEHVLPSHEEVQTGADLHEAERLLGYRPQIRVEDGIEDFVRWYQGEYRQVFPNGLQTSRYWE
jgi:UDP-glucuronate 4-epimerase